MGNSGEKEVSKVIAFPVREAHQGRVFCRRLGVYFPVLYKITVTATFAELEELGLQDDPECIVPIWIHFDLSTANKYVGTPVLEPVTHIRHEDGNESIVIRHHASLEAAYGHLRGYHDIYLADYEKNTCGLYRTDDGIFTFFAIPTNKAWSGPHLFYLACVQNKIINVEEVWAYVVGPDGLAVDPELFGFVS